MLPGIEKPSGNGNVELHYDCKIPKELVYQNLLSLIKGTRTRIKAILSQELVANR